MDIQIKSKYLVFPVYTEAALKHLSFSKDGKEVYGLKIALDYRTPNFYAYVDVARFMGQTLQLSTDLPMPIRFTEADQMHFEDEYREELRPQIHFTTKNGWNNDPNGLVYLDGKYHLFYQYNPCAPQWNNMHWGHAVSEDLLHWQEQDIALFPDELGAKFSGCAIVDEKNLLGLESEKQKAMLLYYTVTRKPFRQCLSYSLDSGKTFIKYEGNPILEHIDGNNRDPKVHWCEELNCYIMALYLTQMRFALLTSKDLVNWNFLQEFAMKGERECPDIFPLTDASGNRLWVFIGANDQYLIGKFTSGRFEAIQPQHALHYGKSNYAAQSFSGIPDQRIIRIAWQTVNVKNSRFSQQMGFPVEASLEKAAGEYYLCTLPIGEIESLIDNTIVKQQVPLSDERLYIDVASAPLLLKIKAKADTAFEMHIFGGKICANPQDNELKVQESRAPLSVSGADIDLTILVDRCSMEVFSDGGKICLTERLICDMNLPYVALSGAGCIDSLQISTLRSIW